MIINEPITLIVLFGSLFLSLLVIIFGLLVFYNLFSRWLSFLKREQQRTQQEIINDAYTEAYKIIDNAKKQSLSLIKDANSKAQETLLQGKEVSQDVRNQWEKKLTEISQELSASFENSTNSILSFYEDLIEKQKKEGHALLTTTSREIEEEVLDEVGEFKDTLEEESHIFSNNLHQQTVGLEKQLSDKLQKEFENAQKDIALYKKHRLEEVDQTIVQIVEKVAREVIGDTISMQEHQNLIFRSLEKIKAQENTPHGNQ